jgi:hypothetical protein
VETNYAGHAVTVNAHLRIAEQMFDPSITQEQFRAFLDRHVFLWPTLRDCRKMIETYTRREPESRFAVLEFRAYSLLAAHYQAVRLSKYDSGSNPRFPASCSYKKSLAMFLPLPRFGMVEESGPVPRRPSEIREVLVQDRVDHISRHLLAVYVQNKEDIPDFRDVLKKEHMADHPEAPKEDMPHFREVRIRTFSDLYE